MCYTGNRGDSMIDNELVLKLNKEGYNTVQIAKQLNCSDSTIGRILKKYGVKAKGNKRKLPPTTEKMMCDLYNQGYTTVEIGKQFGYTDGGIRKILTKNGVKMRRGVRRSVCGKHDFFEVIDSEEKAYFLGLFIADGCVCYLPSRPDRAPVISIELEQEDKYLIEKLKECLDGTMKITQNRSCCKISFASQKMADDLAKYGVVANKSDKTYLPQIQPELMGHLIRGIFDGDGTVYQHTTGKLRFGFYGTNTICNQIKEYYGFEPSVFDKEGVSFICMQKQSDIEKFYSHIYADATVYMVRKKSKFDSYLC